VVHKCGLVYKENPGGWGDRVHIEGKNGFSGKGRGNLEFGLAFCFHQEPDLTFRGLVGEGGERT